MIRATFLLCVSLILAACAKEGIPILGLDDKGVFVETYVNPVQMQDNLQKTTAQVEESTFSALQAAAPEASATLRTVAVGLGFNLRAGIGPVVSVGTYPRVRFFFSNARKPFIPD